MRPALVLALLLGISTASLGQGEPASRSLNRSGHLYFYWGWNWSWSGRSDIHFKGADHDFTLSDVVAKDRQEPFRVKTYLDPRYAPIPQYNFRLGYFLNDHFDVSFGIDHMKYVVQTDQVVGINGTISDEATSFRGIYSDADIKLVPELLLFEHTDGLNYINTEIRRSDVLITRGRFQLRSTEGIGIGMLLPKSNVTLLGRERYDAFHLAGYGLSGMVGLNISYAARIFIQTEFKGGYINMPDIRTTNDPTDKASQHFFFAQYNVVIGASIPLRKN